MSSETKVCSLCKCVNNSSSVYCKRCKRKLDSNTNTKIIAIPDNEIVLEKKISPKRTPTTSVPIKSVSPKVVSRPTPIPSKPVKLVGIDTLKASSLKPSPDKQRNEFLKKAPSLD